MLRGGDQAAQVISDNAFEDDLDTEHVQLLGEVKRISVHAVGSEHLRTHRDYFGIHALRV
jgi:hypothetical protein